jgi:hypothetical protein
LDEAARPFPERRICGAFFFLRLHLVATAAAQVRQSPAFQAMVGLPLA